MESGFDGMAPVKKYARFPNDWIERWSALSSRRWPVSARTKRVGDNALHLERHAFALERNRVSPDPKPRLARITDPDVIRVGEARTVVRREVELVVIEQVVDVELGAPAVAAEPARIRHEHVHRRVLQ